MTPNTVLNRFELGMTFTEFDLAMSRKHFIGPRVFRPALVGLQAANAGKIPLEELLQTVDDHRAPGGGYNGVSMEFGQWNYSTEERALEARVDKRMKAIYRDILDAEFHTSQKAIDGVLRNYEIDCAAKCFNTSADHWNGAALTTNVSIPWSTVATAKPMTDVRAAKLKIFENSGLEANAVIFNRQVYDNLNECEQILERIKYAGIDDPKDITTSILASIFGVKYVLVAGGAKNTAKQPSAATPSRIWSSAYAMVCCVAETDDIHEPCIGRTLMWSEENAGVGTNEELSLIIEEYESDAKRGKIMRARNDRDIQIMYLEAGHLLSNIT